MSQATSVLIVDDNVDLCDNLVDILDDRGYHAVAVPDGSQAIALVEQTPFDVILMDVKMPAMNGVETYKRIKRISPQAVVIMMTAYSVEELVQEALAEGAYGVLYKPLDIDRVVELIERGRDGMLILVVDDVRDICANLLDVLQERGHKVATATSGEEAIALARQTRFDIIFTEIKLPTIGGLATYLAIREISPHVAAIMTTGYRQEVRELVEEALRNNVYACLYKPFDMDEVVALVEEIGRRQAHTST